MLHEALTEEIIYWFYQVHHKLGFGFLEKVYKNALYLELTNAGLKCETEKPINVYYNGKVVGVFYADIVVDGKVILELKAVESMCKEHEYQLINYLKACELEVGLLLNFGKKAEMKRLIYTNDRKTVS
ncbi:GxxExxY protein [Paludibacter jiangxiensis]|uniref:GxxExxY protein n=1 Tax=Paludibacter jiangxiensis TaxID=681398 RepID=A0A161LEG6_9BACT|nr:GxxExxY protein [Paludibacter jiangxiensis]GAT63015.1 GxxExxY protein [Paludibacter jiangxiensis]